MLYNDKTIDHYTTCFDLTYWCWHDVYIDGWHNTYVARS